MRCGLFFLVACFFICNLSHAQTAGIPLWQNYVKTNPIRAGLGEIDLFYEKANSESKSIEYKFGVIYPSVRLKNLLFETSFFPYFFLGAVPPEDIMVINQYGALLGIGQRTYYKNKSYYRKYYQLNAELKYGMVNDVTIYYVKNMSGRSAVVNANRITLKPNVLIGAQHFSQFAFDMYLGVGAAFRFTRLRCKDDCVLEDIRADRFSTRPFTVLPTFHLGAKMGIGVKRF